MNAINNVLILIKISHQSPNNWDQNQIN